MRWMYEVECSVCSIDKELYPEPLTIEKYSALSRGSVPCGCSSVPRWTEYQQKVRIERLCKSRGYILEGFLGETLGDRTYLKLYNPITGNRWESCTVSNFLKGRKDPSLRGETSKVLNSEARGSLVEKSISEHRLYEYMVNLTYTLKGGGYDKERLVVNFDCTNCGTKGISSYLDNIRKGKISCKCKRRPSLYKGKETEKDYLYIMEDISGNKIKVGRSFNPYERLGSVGKYYKGEWKLLGVLSDEHLNISELEQEVLFKFSKYKLEGGTNEILGRACLDNIINYLGSGFEVLEGKL